MTKVIVDEHRFKRLLDCLYANALQLKNPQAPIQIRVRRWGEWVAFQMSYQGEGIPLEQQAQIFRAVDIANDSSSPVLKGVGLRLLLALRLAEEHGGTLTWRSNPGQGIHTTLLFPRRTPLSAAYTSPHESDSPDICPSLSLSFVVIAEDDPSRIDSIFNIVSSLGYGVAIARSGPEALDKVRCLEAQAVIVNPCMEYYSGTTLISILKQTDETRSIPLIAIAPVESTSTRHSTEHIDAYLQYPVDPAILQNQLARLVQPNASVQSAPAAKPITLLYFNPNLSNTSPAPLASPAELDPAMGYAIANPSYVAGSPASPPPLEELDLNAILYPHHCRVIEVDSIDQAELLARVWHPDVIIFGVQPSLQNVHSPLPFQRLLVALKDCDELAHLPLVTLTTEITEFAYDLDLMVFPCLTPLAPVPSNDNQQVTSFALLQVIQLAAASHSSH